MLGKFDIHNPGNIKQSPDLFIGEIKPSSDPRFKEFASNAFGYRAMFKILDTYRKKGYKTITEIITRYAPPTSNDTLSYINHVSKLTGIDPCEILDYGKETMKKIVAAMTLHENGVAGNPDDIEKGYNLYADIETVKKSIPFGLILLVAISGMIILKKEENDNA